MVFLSLCVKTSTLPLPLHSTFFVLCTPPTTPQSGVAHALGKRDRYKGGEIKHDRAEATPAAEAYPSMHNAAVDSEGASLNALNARIGDQR